MSDDGRDTELRLALGMRGGVSLAVWIGGACTEIDRLRRSRSAADGFWGELLERSRYERVAVDVMAGASAGGLNGVLYAASQVHGFPLDAVRDLWLGLGGLHDLLRRPGAEPDGTRRSTTSLLDGDGFFLTRLQESLDRLVREQAGAAGGPRPSVDLQLSATVVEPVERPVRSPVDETLTEQRFAARFHFRHLDDAPWVPSDVLASDGDHAAVTWRLALAARASSAYPVAFEAAAVRSRRRATFATPPPPAEPGPLVDMGGVFSERRDTPAGDAPTDPDFVVMDGGVLDNIPLAKALRAVAAAPADRPTRRFLVYLQPGAPAVTPLTPSAAARPSADARRSSLSVVRGAARALLTSETIAGDIAELEQHNQAVERARVLRLGALGAMAAPRAPAGPTASAPQGQGGATRPADGAGAGDTASGSHSSDNDDSGDGGDGGDLVAMAERAWPTYLRHRGNADAVLVRRLLDDPLTELGDDPFPRTVGGAAVGDDDWRSPLADWPAREREAVEAALFRAFTRRLRPAGAHAFDPQLVLGAGVLPVLRITILLIEWARHLEREGVDGAGEAKAAFYRVHRFATELLDRPRRLAWVARAAASSGREGAEAWAAAAAPSVDLLLRVSPATAEALCVALRYGGDPAPLAAYRDRVCALLDRVLVPEPQQAALDPVDVRPALVATLATVAEELRGKVPSAPAARRDRGPVGEDDDLPAAALDTVLRRAPVTVATLAALEVVCFPEFVAGLPGERRIDFVRLSAANRTPVARWFERLVEEGERQGLTWSPPSVDGERRRPPEGLHVKLKLAGNELMNFTAFVKAEWRANDWLWGRLDAVPTLVDLLVTPESLRRCLGGRTVDEAVGELRGVVTAAPDGDDAGGWVRWLEERVWRAYERDVHAEVEALLRSGPRDHPSVAAIRDALVARRQWEVLSEELAKPFTPRIESGPPAGRRPRLTPLETEDRVREYAWGLETLTRPRHLDHVELFEDLARVGADALVDNVRLLRADGGATLAGPDRVERVAGRAAALLRRFGPMAARWVLAPPTGEDGVVGVLRRPSLLAATLVLVAAVGLGLWAALAHPWVALAAVGACALLVIAAVLFERALTRRRRAAARGAPPPPKRRPAPARPAAVAPDAETEVERAAASAPPREEPVSPAGRG